MYAKVFRQIFNSSIADNWKTRVVFMDMLVLAESDGVVDMTHEAIAAQTRLPIEMVRDAISELEQPDPRSRSRDSDGARLVRLDSRRDWGWTVVNYQKYRSMRCEFDRKTYMRNYMRKIRRGGEEPYPSKPTVLNNSLTDSNSVNTPPSPSSYSCTGKGGVGEREIPDRQIAVSSVMNAGIDPGFAGFVYDDWSTRGGSDASGSHVPFLPYVTKRWARERQEWVAGTHRGNKKAKIKNIFAVE